MFLLLEPIELRIRLKINLVLLVELNLEADSGCNGLKQAGVQECLKLCTKRALEQAEDGFSCRVFLSLRQRLHRAADQNELLLEVVKADDAVDLVPVVDAGFKRGIC